MLCIIARAVHPHSAQYYVRRLLAVTLDDLKRVAEQYLRQQQASKAVVAPVSKREALLELGFEIKQVN